MRYTATRDAQGPLHIVYRDTLSPFSAPRLGHHIDGHSLCQAPRWSKDQITSLTAQERVRTAAQQLEIESFRNPEAFFRIGPFQEVLTGSVGVSYTDNADLTPTNKISDLSFQSGAGL